MIKLLFLFLPICVFSVTKSELQERGWECAKDAFKDFCIGTAKIGLAAHSLIKGDLPSSLYLQIEAGCSFSDCINDIKNSYSNFKDAREWRESRENERD